MGTNSAREILMAEPSSYTGKKVLVTGATGFIGSRLCARLLALGAEVCGVGRRLPRGAESAIQWKIGDLSEENFVDRLFKETKPEVVFHLAGHVAGARDLALMQPTFRDILAATVQVLLSATRHGGPRVVLTGSMEEPDPGQGPSAPSSPYAAAKAAAALYADLFYALYRLPVVNARVFMVYGPGQRDRRKLVPYVILSLLKGEDPKLSGGDRLVDWIYVDDVVEGLLLLGAREGVEGRRFDLGNGVLISVRDVVLQLAQIVRPDSRPQFGALADRPMEQVRKADADATFRAIGWRARTSLEAGLQETVRWYAAHPTDESARA